MEVLDPQFKARLETRINQLPVLPLAVSKLLSLDHGDEEYYDKVLRILEAEPNLTARILQAANSAASAPSQGISTLPGAISRIGSRGATNLVLGVSVTNIFVPRDPWEQSLWRHGVQVAHAARGLAGHAGDDVDPDEIYVSALLHDLGRFVLFQEDPVQFGSIEEGTVDSPHEIVELERSICGVSHAEIGALACTKWRLPTIVARIIRRHHDLLPTHFIDPVDKAIAIIRFADLAMFPSAPAGSRQDPVSIADDLTARMPEFLSIPSMRIRHIMEKAETDANEACQALGIAV